MEELVRTNDPVLISFLESLLDEAGIKFFVADGNMSILEGGIGIFPRRLMVRADEYDAAMRVLRDNDVPTGKFA